MYTLLRNAKPSEFVWANAPAVVIAFVVAELFFKWKSFALECLGFLALWLALDWIFSTIHAAWTKRYPPTSATTG